MKTYKENKTALLNLPSSILRKIWSFDVFVDKFGVEKLGLVVEKYCRVESWHARSLASPTQRIKGRQKCVTLSGKRNLRSVCGKTADDSDNFFASLDGEISKGLGKNIESGIGGKERKDVAISLAVKKDGKIVVDFLDIVDVFWRAVGKNEDWSKRDKKKLNTHFWIWMDLEGVCVAGQWRMRWKSWI